MPVALPKSVKLRPPAQFDTTARVPGSKSLTNRALLLAAVAAGESHIDGWLDADDTRLMCAALTQVGTLDDISGSCLTIRGTGGPFHFAPNARFEVGTAGTVARFLVPVLAAGRTRCIVDGSARMRQRPMTTLLDALRDLGAHIDYLDQSGALPIGIGPHTHRLHGGELSIARPASSQFVSGLIFAGLLSQHPLALVLEQGTPARPYVDMTVATAQAFGASMSWHEPNRLQIYPGGLRGRHFEIEPDASAASYFFALAAIYGGSIRVDHLGGQSRQGDAQFPGVIRRMGAEVDQGTDYTTVRGTGHLEGGRFDLSDMPDMALTLAVMALFATGKTRIEGIEVLRHHESDRIAVAATELERLGATVEVESDAITIDPPARGPRRGVAIETYQDHRVAMAFSLVGDVEIIDPACTTKTFPGYFDELARLGMVLPSTP